MSTLSRRPDVPLLPAAPIARAPRAGRLAALAGAALLPFALAPRGVVAQQPAAPTVVATEIPTIAVSGTGEETVTPDRARLMIGVQTTGATAAVAARANARLQQAVLDTLRALGIPSEQIGTSGYNVFPDQEFDQQTRRPKIRGYNVQNTVVVELRRLDQVGPALDASLAKGANNIGGLQFYSSQAEAARRRALAKAVAAARADAEAMAAAAGGQLGAVLELSTGTDYRPRPMEMVQMRGMAASAPADTPIAEGTQTVSATVQARWRFVQTR